LNVALKEPAVAVTANVVLGELPAVNVACATPEVLLTTVTEDRPLANSPVPAGAVNVTFTPLMRLRASSIRMTPSGFANVAFTGALCGVDAARADISVATAVLVNEKFTTGRPATVAVTV
jgi:hypothetical protein